MRAASLPCPRYGKRAVRAVLPWQRRYWKLWKQRRAISIRFIEDELSLEEKITKIAKEIYGAEGVSFSPTAKKQLQKLTDLNFGKLPVCMAKNQYSLSDDPKKLGRPENFEITIREAYVSAGAGFVVALTGDVMTMPGTSRSSRQPMELMWMMMAGLPVCFRAL